MSNYFRAFQLTSYDSAKSEIVHLLVNVTGSRIIATRTDRSLRIWKCYPGKVGDLVVIERPHAKPVERVAWNPVAEHTFATVGRDDLVKVWRGTSLEKEIQVTRDDGRRPQCLLVSYSHDGDVLAVADTDVVVFYSVAGNYARAGEVRLLRPYDMVWFHGGHYFAVALADGTVPIYQFGETPRLKHTLRGHRLAATSLAVDPRGRYLVVGGNEGVVSIWQLRSMVPTRLITQVDEAVVHVDVSRDGAHVSVSFDGVNARIWDISKEDVHEIPDSAGGTSVGARVCWFPNKVAYAYVSDAGHAFVVCQPARRQ